MSNTNFIFPAIPLKLFYKNKRGKTNIIRFSNKDKIICFKNGDIALKSKDIGIKLYNVDKLWKIEYKRNQKSWKKYNGRTFLHYFFGSEKVYGYADNPNLVRIKDKNRLWSYQKIKDEEVE